MQRRIAILGATSHIAKGLILNFLQNTKNSLFLFARRPQDVISFLQVNGCELFPKIQDFAKFENNKYDIIINCVGLGTPNKVKMENNQIFNLTERFDNLVLEYLKKYRKACYINLSSGAVYSVACDDIRPEHYYGIAKLYQEARHRSLNKLHIVDIRIFSYFSRFIDLNSGFFLTDIIKCIKTGTILETNSSDFIRDYLSPQDFFNLICLIIGKRFSNFVVDAYSAAPIRKFELLGFLTKKYALKYKIRNNLKLDSPTGKKDTYFSRSRKALSLLGYKPKNSSLETIAAEIIHIP
ncbi:MAG: NAD(P)-dependent oxidoreductase [Elusimicrobia bacterium]|nr:NAD(P)-dependent oxidoreductase [Elusimicrobiota bacterium]